VIFMVIGIFLLVTQHPVDGATPGPSLITDNGGIFPNGLLPMLLIIQGVVFAYASVELVGVAAGETENPEKIMPKAINSIMWRVGLFYVGSVVLLSMLLPWNKYTAGQSPFVTVLSHIGVPAAGGVMNLVVLTAAMSSLNSGLYSTGRILRSMAVNGSAPKFTGKMSRTQVPYGGILLTSGICVLGVGLNFVVPADAFEIVLNFAAIGIISTWGMIMLCHLLFWRKTQNGELIRPGYRLPGSPWTEIVTLAFLASVLVLMYADGGAGRTTVLCVPLIVAALVAGWYAVRRRVARPSAGTDA
ncbi:L-asparagine permease, partial [Streptomyces sp. NPDC005921]